jgi:hypothetical protein
MNDWKTHKVLVHHGKQDSRRGTKSRYETLSLGEIFAMQPQAVPKDKAAAMIPSTYAEAEGRTHSVQESLGQFVVLTLDIDAGNPTFTDVAEAVDVFVGQEVASLIYSTASASADEPKWRALIPLESPVPFHDWRRAQQALHDFIASRGLLPDRSLARAGQSVYLPNVPPDRRGPDGAPLFFESEPLDGRGLRLADPVVTEWLPQNLPTQSHQQPELAEALRLAAKRNRTGPIQRFNGAHTIEALLTKYGYARSPIGQDWRSPYQTSGSFATRVWSEGYWTSLSGSDTDAGLGHKSSSGARFGDAFDLYCHFEHSGDLQAAISAFRILDAAALTDEAEALARSAEAGDVGAPFERASLDVLNALRVADPAAFMRIRARLQAARVGVGQLDQALKRVTDGSAAKDDRSVADELIELARKRCRFVHDSKREPYAVVEVSGARQIHGIHSPGFSDFISHAYYAEHDRAPHEAAIKVALATLRGQAQFDGETVEVHTRIAKTEAGYWLDLCNDAWQSVRITPTDWEVMAGEATPMFNRSASTRPLPVPERGGTLEALWPLVNIPGADRLLVLAWLLECLRADTPHVVLELVGEQGSAKSSTQRALRRLIDPNQADLRAAPKSVEDVWIAARNSHMVSLENLSHLPPQYQDALCVLATGGGYSARTLYTNADETILELRKPVVLNGISVIVTAQDLLDRCLHIELPSIQNRESSGDIDARFKAAQPRLLGALLDLFVKVLAILPEVTIAPEDRPRMFDFALLGEAVFRVYGKQGGAFVERYASMRRDSIIGTIDTSPVGAALLAFLEQNPAGYSGCLTDLLSALERYRPIGEAAWPRSAKGLGDALRRLSPALRVIGFECKAMPKTGGVIPWHIYRRPERPKPTPACPESPAPGGHVGYSGYGLSSPSSGEYEVSPRSQANLIVRTNSPSTPDVLDILRTTIGADRRASSIGAGEEA